MNNASTKQANEKTKWIVSMNPIPEIESKPPVETQRDQELEEIFFVEIVPKPNFEPPPLSQQEINEREECIKWVFKYKPVARRKRPVPNVIPENVKVKRRFPSDPLVNLPKLPIKAPVFAPTSKFTTERMEKLAIDKNPDLSSDEINLLQYILVLNERSIVFDENERGTFRQDYFSDYQMPVMEHEPWREKNIPLPPGY